MGSLGGRFQRRGGIALARHAAMLGAGVLGDPVSRERREDFLERLELVSRRG
jgi:hypothetical protein